MDYKKEDNEKTAEVLKEKLNLTRLPVAIKFFNDESEIPDGVENSIQLLQNKNVKADQVQWDWNLSHLRSLLENSIII